MNSTENRFWSKVEISNPNSCWNWKAGTFTDGYGKFKVNGKSKRAHRYSWSLKNGIECENCVCHKCNNRLCVNPLHLYEDTNAGNLKYRNDCDRTFKPKGELNPMSKLNYEQVKEIRKAFISGNPKLREIAEQFGVSQCLISMIKNNKLWFERNDHGS